MKKKYFDIKNYLFFGYETSQFIYILINLQNKLINFPYFLNSKYL